MTAHQNPLTSIEPFETIRPGHRVVFHPKHAIGGGQGRRKPVIGRVSNLDPVAKTVQVGTQLIPMRHVRRLTADVYRAWSSAERKAQQQHVYGGLARHERGWLQKCAKDARHAYLSPDNYSGPLNKQFYAAVKRQREKFMRERGWKDFTDREQCEALPLFIERAIDAGQLPRLESAQYVSADSGVLGLGDKVSIGGKQYVLDRYVPEGKAVLKNGHTVAFPMEYIPVDRRPKASLMIRKPFKEVRPPALPKSRRPMRTTVGQRRRRPWNSKASWCYCFGRDKSGAFTSLTRKPKYGGRSMPTKNPLERIGSITMSPIRQTRSKPRHMRWDSRKTWCYRHCASRDAQGRFRALKRGRNPGAELSNWGDYWPWLVAAGAVLWLLNGNRQPAPQHVDGIPQ